MYDHLEKPKQRPNEDVGLIDALLRFAANKPEQFQFTVEVPITVCVERLNALDEKRDILGYVTGRPRIQVDIEQEDDSTYYAEIYGQRLRFPWISVICHLEKQTDNLTLVTGTAKTDYPSWQVIQMIIAIPVLLLASSCAQTVFFSRFFRPPLAALIAIFFSVTAMLFIIGGNIAFATFNTHGFRRFMEDTMRFGKYQATRKKKYY